MDYRDKIKSMVEQRPVQPTEVAKVLNTNSMLSSAMLSEMSEKGILKVSHLKVGSSPLYYHPDHPEQLLDFVQHANEKDRKTIALLKEKGVVRDQGSEPLLRVSLRNIRDFARPLDVTIDGNKELFWKFYLLTDDQAAEKIKQLMQPAPAPMPLVSAKPVKPRKPRVKKPKQQQEFVAPQPVAPVQPASFEQQPLPSSQEASAPMPKETSSPSLTDDPFLTQLLSFFGTNSITVLEQVVLKKKSEYDFLVQLSSPVGQLNYYCKAKNKTKVSEADLSHAFVQGQLRKLPILFLSPGQLTRPAQELIKELKGLTVKQV